VDRPTHALISHGRRLTMLLNVRYAATLAELKVAIDEAEGLMGGTDPELVALSSTLRVAVHREKLTDGSVVYDLYLTEAKS
jgi:hypothetical protein